MLRLSSMSLLLSALAASFAFPAELAYLSGGKLHGIQDDGTGARRISNADDYQNEGKSCWSPDGARLVVARTGGPCTWLWAMNADGTGETVVGGHTCTSQDPRWLPNGLRVVFRHCCGPSGLSISTVGQEGSEDLVQGSKDGAFAVECFDLSRDGLRTAYITRSRDVPHRLYVVPIAGGEPRLLSERLPTSDRLSSLPSFSPDGQRVAFVGVTKGNQDIHTIGIDGQNQQCLTTSSDRDSDPAWSPDGKTIAFVTGPERARRVALMDSDGSNIRVLPEPVAAYCGDVAWSPDGTKLAFAAGPEGAGRIYIADCQTLSCRRLTNGPGNDSYPQWRPVPPR
jgi:Tol biopolymer transport system component